MTNNKLNVVFTNEVPFIRTLTNSSVAPRLMRMFNPLSYDVTLRTDFYFEGKANQHDFSAFLTERDVVVFYRSNPAIWTLLVDHDFWQKNPGHESFVEGSTPLSCIYECLSILKKVHSSRDTNHELETTLDLFASELRLQPDFTFND